MKKISIIISLASAALLFSAATTYADHDKNCKDSKHGTVSAKTDGSVTVGGTTYNTASSAVSREDGGIASADALKVGDHVCIQTASADSKDASKILVLNKESKDSPSVASDTPKGYTTMSEVERKAHEKICKGHHGTITDKTANSLTVDGKIYAFKINTPVNKQGEALLPKTSKVGDRVCFDTAKAADGSQQITALIGIDEQSDRTRVRDTDIDSEPKEPIEVK